MMDSFPRRDATAMGRYHFSGSNNNDGPCIPWGIDNTSTVNQQLIVHQNQNPQKRQWHEFQQGSSSTAMHSSFPIQQQHSRHQLDQQSSTEPPMMSLESSTSSEEDEEQNYQQHAGITAAATINNAMEIVGSPARPYKRRRTVSTYRPPDSPFLLGCHDTKSNNTATAMNTSTPSSSQNSFDTSMDESVSTTGGMDSSMYMEGEIEGNVGQQTMDSLSAASTAATSTKVSTRLPVVEWWKRPRRCVLPIATIPEEDGGPKRVSLDGMEDGEQEIREKLDSTCSGDGLAICHVCQHEFVLPPLPQVTDVMPVNSLLNYFAPKPKSSSTMEDMNAMETTSSTANRRDAIACGSSSSTTVKNPAACACCDRLSCDACCRECETCSQTFCVFCTIENEDGGSFCLDCHRDVTKEARREDEDDDETNPFEVELH